MRAKAKIKERERNDEEKRRKNEQSQDKEEVFDDVILSIEMKEVDSFRAFKIKLLKSIIILKKQASRLYPCLLYIIEAFIFIFLNAHFIDCERENILD